MEVITMESSAFKRLTEKIETIERFVVEKSNKADEDLDSMWIDNYAVCQYLQISERTLQRLRSARSISYSMIGGKTYYTLGEIKRTLQQRLIRRNEDLLSEMIAHHKRNLEKTIKR